MSDDHRRAWAIPRLTARGSRPSEVREGDPLWLRDVSTPGGLLRFVLLDSEQRIASPEDCIRRHGELLRRPKDFVMVLDGDDGHFYEIVDWPLNFRESVRRIVYCVTLMRVGEI